MNKILELNSIHDYHSFIGYEMLHPFISVVDFSKVKPLKHARKMYDFYIFFSYESNESLHMSERERQVFMTVNLSPVRM